jgi:DNA-binding CsgD family transcriptional regulator
LELLAQRHSTVRIAAELKIADETARNHIRLLLGELDVHTRLAAVVVAFRNGLL